MRHRHKKSVRLETGTQKRGVVTRNLLTSLVKYGQITTTPAKARVLKAEANRFFSSLVKRCKNLSEADALRENIRQVKATIYGEIEGKKVVQEILPAYVADKKQSFVADYKVGYRAGDAATKILVKLI